MTPFILAAIEIPEKFKDLIQYAFFTIMGVLFLCAVGFAVWAGLSLERREEAMLKMKGVILAFAMVGIVAAIFDAMGWSAKLGLSFVFSAT
jgi:hypothetical protein